MRTGFAAVRFGWTAFVVPFLFVAAPSLLLEGAPFQVAWAVATAVDLLTLLSGFAQSAQGHGVVGYLRRPLFWPVRIGAMVAGILMLIPAGAFPGAIVTDFAGIALAVVIVGYEWLRGRTPTVVPVKAGPGA